LKRATPILISGYCLEWYSYRVVYLLYMDGCLFLFIMVTLY